MSKAKRIAVITGASSGLGREFVQRLDALGTAETDLEEFWVIARRRERLEALQEEVDTPLRILDYDLTAADTIDRIRALLEEEQPDIRLLINAAGLGKIGPTDTMPISQINRMIDLNCRAAVDMTQICLPHMRENSHIMEICSVAAFQPIQYLNVYAASKAFLYRYSRALRAELLPKRIYVTAVCPYWIKDTEFIPAAAGQNDETAAATTFEGKTEGGQDSSSAAHTAEGGQDSSSAAHTAEADGRKYFRSFPFASSVEDVAETALAHTKLGLAVCTPGPIAWLDRLFGKVLSSDLMMAIIALLRRIPESRN